MRRPMRIPGWMLVVMLGLGLVTCGPLGPEVATRASDYQTLLRGWEPADLTDHFPRTIPADATHVSLAAFPGFLQGKAFFQLRMTLPPSEIEAIRARAMARAIRSCPSQCTDAIQDPAFWSVPTLIAGSPSDERFPSDFVVYAFETNRDWNHPTGKGVAISVARGEVVYWAEAG